MLFSSYSNLVDIDIMALVLSNVIAKKAKKFNLVKQQKRNVLTHGKVQKKTGGN